LLQAIISAADELKMVKMMSAEEIVGKALINN